MLLCHPCSVLLVDVFLQSLLCCLLLVVSLLGPLFVDPPPLAYPHLVILNLNLHCCPLNLELHCLHPVTSTVMSPSCLEPFLLSPTCFPLFVLTFPCWPHHIVPPLCLSPRWLVLLLVPYLHSSCWPVICGLLLVVSTMSCPPTVAFPDVVSLHWLEEWVLTDWQIAFLLTACLCLVARDRGEQFNSVQ